MRIGYAIARLLLRILFIAVLRGRVFGRQHLPRTGGVLLVSNHQSFLDPMLAAFALPRACSFMARDTLFRHALFGPLIAYLGAFPVKRGTADLGAIKEALRRLKSGRVVLTFPEGTRSPDGRIGEMRPGVVLLARKARVPIVPMVILGAFEAWPRTAKLPHARPILVAYDAPLRPHEHPEWSDDECVAAVRNRVLALQAQYAGHRILSR